MVDNHELSWHRACLIGPAWVNLVISIGKGTISVISAGGLLCDEFGILAKSSPGSFQDNAALYELDLIVSMHQQATYTPCWI
jgi:hypothetical protein